MTSPWQLVYTVRPRMSHVGPLLLWAVSPYVGPSSSCGLGAYSNACAPSRPVVPMRNGLMKAASSEFRRELELGLQHKRELRNSVGLTELQLGRVVDRVRHNHARGIVACSAVFGHIPARLLDTTRARGVRRPLEAVGGGARRDDAPHCAAYVLQGAVSTCCRATGTAHNIISRVGECEGRG